MAEAAPDPGPLPRDQTGVLIAMHDHHLGNFVLALPALQVLCAHFDRPPDLLVDERHEALARLLPARPHVLRYPSRALSANRLSHALRELAALARVRTRRYRVVIDLMNMIRSMRLARFSGAPTRIALEGQRYARPYTRLLPAAETPHCADRYGRFCDLTDRPGRPAPLPLSAPDAARRFAEDWIGRHASGEGPLVLIHPTSGKTYRHWPAERFAAVADRLIASRGARIVLIHSPSENAHAVTVRRAMRAESAAPSFLGSIDQLLALFERADLLVSNESGPTHLAAVTTIPIVTIFGPSSESEWRPRRQQDLTVLRGAACETTCHPARCQVHYRCLMDLSVEAVARAAESLLARRV